MELFLLPQRCLCCGQASPGETLCRACHARFQTGLSPDPALGLCSVCGQLRLAEADLCMDCGAQRWSFPGVQGLFGYNDPAGELLRVYKFGGQKGLARLWARRMGLLLTPRAPLVPVPSLRRRVWQRGWDPVLHLVLALGRDARLPVWRVLVRRPSRIQKTLGRAARLENAREAYGIHPGKSALLAGQSLVWLVDDVVTTGATVEACAAALLAAGVAEVRVLCLGLH